MAAWEPAFSFYVTRLDGALASVVVDLHARPQRSHPHCVVIDVALRHPREDGLRDERELDTMGSLEDTLVERLEQALYVGRVTTRGRVQFVFYAATPLEVPGTVADYPLLVTTQLEPDWQTLARALYPGPFELQTILNRNLLDQLAAQGDALTHPRELDHFAFFDTLEQATQAATALRAKGFRVEAPTTSDGKTSLSFHRVDSVGEGRIDQISAEVLEIVLAGDGAYDGWGCGVVPSAS
jgi:regulator of RNase E activity RraB